MLGGNKDNPVPPFLIGNRYQYQSNASNQLQLFGSVPSPCGVDRVNYVPGDNIMRALQMNKLDRGADEIPAQQKLQTYLNHGTFRNEFDCTATIRAPNPVFTGLRLSYDDDEHNSSVSSAGGSMTAKPSTILSLDKSIATELDRQNEELDQFIKVQALLSTDCDWRNRKLDSSEYLTLLKQEEYLRKGIRDMTERHIASFLSAVERGVNKKLLEKDMEIENMNRRNRELGEIIKQVTVEVQNWQYRAKYNESVANVLRSNLQQAISMGADQGKEGFGDSEVDDDAASYVNPKNKHLGLNRGSKEGMACKVCKFNEVSVLLIPCRHLCLCKDCNGLVNVCPVCRLTVTDRVPVYLS